MSRKYNYAPSVILTVSLPPKRNGYERATMAFPFGAISAYFQRRFGKFLGPGSCV